MNAQQPIFLIESHGFAAEKLLEVLGAYGFSEGVKVVADASNMADSAVLRLSSPVRIGGVIDQILHFQRDHIAGQRDVISFGGYRLDRYQGLFYVDDVRAPVRLTEKEVALLVLLYEAKGGPVSREVLLEQIWKYAENVETHTLETHIYRLRQKIENDPAEPTLLCTSDKGYFLSLE